jgi:cytochrome c551/c552
LLFAAPPAEEGKSIFAARCASCHNVNKTLTGPALAGIHERRSLDWIASFIKSSQSMIKSGDKDAVALFEKYNKIPMPDHMDLNTDQIKGIVEYIKSEGATAEVETAPFSKLTKLRPLYLPLSLANDYGFFIGFLILVVMLIAALLFAVQLKQYERAQEENA